MIGSLQTGISGLEAFQQDLQVIGNNIANVDTVGYKSDRMEFQDTLSQSLLGGVDPMQVGTGVATAAISTFFTPGPINSTGVVTDMAITGQPGEGFFVVKNPGNGQLFVTRDGEFTRDNNGYLITNSGYRLQGYTGPGAPYPAGSPIGDIQINDATAIAALNDTTVPPPTLVSFTIDSSGQVNANLSDGVTGVMAQVVLQNFTNPQALVKQGGNVYTYTNTAGPLAAPGAPGTGNLGSIASGYVETSNVDLGTEMANMITAQRAFEANAKIITTSDEILQTLVNIKR
jgi:flagellar hook protein FlgE